MGLGRFLAVAAVSVACLTVDDCWMAITRGADVPDAGHEQQIAKTLFTRMSTALAATERPIANSLSA